MRRLLAVCAFLAAVPLLGQTTIQKIEFQSRIPSNLLRSQSMLREGSAYTEADLEIAMARLRNLPFVYAATYRVEGSKLVIEVVDDHHVSFGFDSAVQWHRVGGFSDSNGIVNGEIGGNWYLPWASVVKGSYGLRSDTDLRSSTWGAEYAQYALFGTPAYVIARMDRSTGEGTSAPQLFVGFPLTLRQTIAVHGIRSHSFEKHPQGLQGGFYSNTNHSDNVAAEWIWSSQNDPLFANRGSRFNVEAGKTKESSAFESVSGSFHAQSESRSNTTDWHGEAQTFRPLGRGALRGVLSADWSSGERRSGSAITGESVTFSTRDQEVLATIGFVYNFFDSIGQLRSSRNRAELAIGVNRFSTRFAAGTSRLTLKTIEAGYAFRNRGANIHFVLTYASD